MEYSGGLSGGQHAEEYRSQMRIEVKFVGV